MLQVPYVPGGSNHHLAFELARPDLMLLAEWNGRLYPATEDRFGVIVIAAGAQSVGVGHERAKREFSS